MPCSDGGHPSDYEVLKPKLDNVTRMLCGLMGELEKWHGHQFDMSSILYHHKDLGIWWKAHQLEDRRRIENERQEKKDIDDTRAALKKLSARERKLLSRKDLEIHSGF